MESKNIVIIKIILEIMVSILILKILIIFFPSIIVIKKYCYTLIVLIIFLIHLGRLKDLFKKVKIKEVKLFNIYYINYQKVFEICMLINNRRSKTGEFLYKNEYSDSISLEGGFSINKKNIGINPNVVKENSMKKTYEYKELQEIKATNSTYLSEIIDVCKPLNSENLKNGDLIKINNVQLEIINKDEIAQISSMVSGIFNGNKISTNSDGQTFNIDINAITNILLKDYKYNLKGVTKDSKEFLVSIPIKAEKEFENDYSIYDLEIGEVNIIGIYRTDSYKCNETSTFDYLQKIGTKNTSNNFTGDELITSNNIKNNTPASNINPEKSYLYVDLIAIEQDLNIKKGEKI